MPLLDLFLELNARFLRTGKLPYFTSVLHYSNITSLFTTKEKSHPPLKQFLKHKFKAKSLAGLYLNSLKINTTGDNNSPNFTSS